MNHSISSFSKLKEPSYHDEYIGILGCEHYSRKVKLQADCCGEWVTCRFCHDENSSHEMPRKETKRMCCMVCFDIQPPQQYCRNCDEELSAYYCSTCKFWDDTPEKEIYHCDGCGICRVGRGPEIDYIHCYDCTLCVPKDIYCNHKCIEYNSKADCPICGEYLFTSVKPLMFMPCEHMIHSSCHTLLCETSFQCPVCRKSLANAQHKFDEIEKNLNAKPSKNQSFSHLSQEILCYDCDSSSIVCFHPLYHKCENCNSYSTKLIDTFNPTFSINSQRGNKAKPKNQTTSKKTSTTFQNKKSGDLEACSISTLVSELNDFYPYDDDSSDADSIIFKEVKSQQSSSALTTCNCDESYSYIDECSCKDYSEWSSISSRSRFS